jgi:hypothetical protein
MSSDAASTSIFPLWAGEFGADASLPEEHARLGDSPTLAGREVLGPPFRRRYQLLAPRTDYGGLSGVLVGPRGGMFFFHDSMVGELVGARPYRLREPERRLRESARSGRSMHNLA